MRYVVQSTGYVVRGMECSVQSALYGTWDEVSLALWPHAFYRSCNTNFQSIVFKKNDWMISAHLFTFSFSIMYNLFDAALQIFLGGFAK